MKKPDKQKDTNQHRLIHIFLLKLTFNPTYYKVTLTFLDL